MSKLAPGREGVAERREGPQYASASSWRSIPPEPDEIWDALATFDNVVALQTATASAAGARLTGLVAELSRQKDRLAGLLQRISLTEKSLEAVSMDTAPAVTGINLARIGEDEATDVRLLSNPDALIVTLKGRGFGMETLRSLRLEYVNSSGAQRVVPLMETRRTEDLVLIEWAAPGPLSSFQAVVGSQVALILSMTLRSGRATSRCVERFALG